jgi:hypothetical protein
MIAEYLIAAGIMGGIGVLLATVLAIADKKFYVFEDPRIDEVEGLLPKANCGACGCAGCRAFAEKAVKGEIAPGKCTVNTKEGILAIATLLQVDAGAEEKRVARLACAGGSHVAKMKAGYAEWSPAEPRRSCPEAASPVPGDASASPTACGFVPSTPSIWMRMVCLLWTSTNARLAEIA